MQRLEFITNSLAAILGMSSLKELHTFSETLVTEEKKMPLLFVGHGSPMNGIEDNEFSQRWTKLAKEIPVPAAVKSNKLVVDVH